MEKNERSSDPNVTKIISLPKIKIELDLGELRIESELRLFSENTKMGYFIIPTEDAKVIKDILQKNNMTDKSRKDGKEFIHDKK